MRIHHMWSISEEIKARDNLYKLFLSATCPSCCLKVNVVEVNDVENVINVA